MAKEISGKWTIETYAAHNEAMRKAEKQFQKERDKRYSEGNELRAKALNIKQLADENALKLASEAQTYKESRNDAMREQNLKETGVYATREDLAGAIQEIRTAIKPLVDYVSGQQGLVKGGQLTAGKIIAGITLASVIIGLFVVLATMFVK